EDKFFAYERSYGSFSRSFVLPESADSDHIDAELENGVLHVHIPKRAEKEPRKIKVGEAAAKPMTEKSTQPGLGANATEEKQQAPTEPQGVKAVPVEQKVASGGRR